MCVKLFAERLRQARRNVGMTQADVAYALYTDQCMISRYETGERIPDMPRTVELAKMYGVSMDWLCGMEEVRHE